ncbi:hypothetical protein DFJ73DRAFT_522673 [Zopfochytrium polystomum]|nr:hypothetical protein DFJ73DRAFT_522673 [Zopfochytrium polystomum]
MSRSPAMSSAASVSLPCLRHADPAEAADGSARASDRGYEPFADAIRSVLLGIAALDGRPAADQLRSELPVPAAQASLGQLAHLDRIVQISNHIYDSQSAFDKPSTSTSGELPGIYYLINPFAGRELHDAINLVSPRRFTWTHIMEALEKGTLDGLFDMRPTFPERHAVEQMILSLVFLTMHSQSTCNAPAAKALFGETITRILRKELPLQRGSTLSTNLWWDVFRFKSVRFRPAGDSVRDHFWLEQLEKIRLDQAASDGLIRRTPQSPPLSSVEMKRLSNLLSSSLYTAVDFAKSCPTIAVANLEILSEYANQLPLNWFTTAILDFALDVLDQWSGPNSPQQKGFVLDSGHALKFLAAWLRKADVTKTDRRANRTLEIVASGVESAKPAVTPSVTWIVAALNCLSALYAKLEENMKTLILTTLYELLSKLLPVVE